MKEDLCNFQNQTLQKWNSLHSSFGTEEDHSGGLMLVPADSRRDLLLAKDETINKAHDASVKTNFKKGCAVAVRKRSEEKHERSSFTGLNISTEGE